MRFGYRAMVDERRAVNDNPPTVRLFRRHEEARDAIRALTKTGVGPRAISVIARSALEVRALHRETGAAEDLEAKVRRDVLWEVLDILGSIESLLVPGFGGILVTGDLVPHITAVVDDIREGGAITASLVKLGIPADEAAALERAVAEGQTLVIVRASADAR